MAKDYWRTIQQDVLSSSKLKKNHISLKGAIEFLDSDSSPISKIAYLDYFRDKITQPELVGETSHELLQRVNELSRAARQTIDITSPKVPRKSILALGINHALEVEVDSLKQLLNQALSKVEETANTAKANAKILSTTGITNMATHGSNTEIYFKHAKNPLLQDFYKQLCSRLEEDITAFSMISTSIVGASEEMLDVTNEHEEGVGEKLIKKSVKYIVRSALKAIPVAGERVLDVVDYADEKVSAMQQKAMQKKITYILNIVQDQKEAVSDLTIKKIAMQVTHAVSGNFTEEKALNLLYVLSPNKYKTIDELHQKFLYKISGINTKLDIDVPPKTPVEKLVKVCRYKILHGILTFYDTEYDEWYELQDTEEEKKSFYEYIKPNILKNLCQSLHLEFLQISKNSTGIEKFSLSEVVFRLPDKIKENDLEEVDLNSDVQTLKEIPYLELINHALNKIYLNHSEKVKTTISRVTPELKAVIGESVKLIVEHQQTEAETVIPQVINIVFYLESLANQKTSKKEFIKKFTKPSKNLMEHLKFDEVLETIQQTSEEDLGIIYRYLHNNTGHCKAGFLCNIVSGILIKGQPLEDITGTVFDFPVGGAILDIANMAKSYMDNLEEYNIIGGDDNMTELGS